MFLFIVVHKASEFI